MFVTQEDHQPFKVGPLAIFFIGCKTEKECEELAKQDPKSLIHLSFDNKTGLIDCNDIISAMDTNQKLKKALEESVYLTFSFFFDKSVKSIRLDVQKKTLALTGDNYNN